MVADLALFAYLMFGQRRTRISELMILKVEKAESRALSVSQKVFSKKKYRT
jgi:hypothetical protein